MTGKEFLESIKALEDDYRDDGRSAYPRTLNESQELDLLRDKVELGFKAIAELLGGAP